MNRAKLKSYAPQARRDFIQAMTDRAAYFGLTANKTEPVVEKGDVAVIGGRSFPIAVAKKRKALEDRIKRHGFEQTMEAMAYTWFNRLVAIRFMELHGYLDHGYRVLSTTKDTNYTKEEVRESSSIGNVNLTTSDPSPSSSFRVFSVFRGSNIPEILLHAEHVELPGLKKETVIDLKLAGNKDAELYRKLLVGQCNALNSAMPFLFEKIDDETELLLPDNLLHSDSLIRKLVSNLDAEDCESVEVLGWLYQFYISERKDQVMACKSAVPTEDIPAVTQLFTPHWIVRYLVENSLGRLWLLNRPNSRLREHMPYYIEGEAETDFLRISKPEEIRLCDPAVGSGHMLTYAFDLLTLIYEEEGYAPSEIPGLILRHNLHGLEICPRAAQLAELALVFKAREKSRRFFQPEHLVRPRIIELRDVRFAENELRDYIRALGLGDLFNQPMLRLLHQFEEAKNFGSLIQPCLDERAIANVRKTLTAHWSLPTADSSGQLFLRETHLKVLRVLEQAEALTQRYHVVVANPPYMGSSFQNESLREFARGVFSESKSDLCTMFLERGFEFVAASGYVSMVTMESWMFLSSMEDFRKALLNSQTLVSLLHLGFNVMGIAFGTAASSWQKGANPDATTTCLRVTSTELADDGTPLAFGKGTSLVRVRAIDLASLPGSPMAYWASTATLRAFSSNHKLDQWFFSDGPCKTGNDAKYLRLHWELSSSDVGASSKWCLCSKGGAHRKFHGNVEHVIRWDGPVRAHYRKDKIARITPEYLWKQRGITWTIVSAKAESSFRTLPADTRFNSVSPTIFMRDGNPEHCYDSILAFLNSRVADHFLTVLNPTLALNVGNVLSIPVHEACLGERTGSITLAAIARADWDNFETSWDFRDQPLLRPGLKGATLETSWRNWEAQSTAAIRRMQELETENNRLFIAAYGLDGELQPEVPEEQITLARAEARRDMAAFLSYAVGCMMGRYSPDHPGLILANAGDTLREFLEKVGKPLAGLTFAPDEDGIIPVLDKEWFDDDIVARTRDFLRATFGDESLNANIQFIEQSLGKDLRKYFLTDFYKDHLQTYKKRPIYWLFSSGKQRAFQCLVYLHRYHEGTLARMRTEYVMPLQGRIAARIEQLEGDKIKATSTSHGKKLQKEQDDLKKQQAELLLFDETLRHVADKKISLDLDDGVKVNYAKFGDLLAEAKAICGTKEDD